MSTTKTTRIENLTGLGVDVAGLAKVEDTGKNICTAWVKFDGTTTPPTIKDSFNVASVARTATGVFELTLNEAMDNTNFAITGMASRNITEADVYSFKESAFTRTTTKVGIQTSYADSASRYWTNCVNTTVFIFGGKA